MVDSTYAADDDPAWLRKKVESAGIANTDFQGIYVVIKGNAHGSGSVIPIKEIEMSK